MKVLLHVNYCEGQGKLDQLFELAKTYGYDGVELRWKYRFDDMDQAQYQKKIAALKSEYPDFEITFGGMVDFCRGAEDDVKKDTADYLKFLEWAKADCGTKVMNFFTGVLHHPDVDYTQFHVNGSGLALEADYEKSAAGLKIIGDKAAELNMLIALETHNAYLHDLATPCKKLMDMTAHDSVGINYDHGNIILNKNGEPINKVFELLDGKIYYAHLKNAMVFRHQLYMITHLDQGHINTMEVMKGLKNNLKSDIIAVEYPATGDGFIAAKRDMEYIKFLKDWLEID
jgi:sugar phosphate isomerase/epimerase